MDKWHETNINPNNKEISNNSNSEIKRPFNIIKGILNFSQFIVERNSSNKKTTTLTPNKLTTPSNNKENEQNNNFSTQDNTISKRKKEEDLDIVEIDSNLCCEKLDFNDEMFDSEPYIESILFKEENEEDKIEQSYNLYKNIFEIEDQYFLKRDGIYIHTCDDQVKLMRAELIDWLMDLSYQMGLKRNTFHLSICLLDKFLSLETKIDTGKLQLYGATTLVIACKFEERAVPRLQNFYQFGNFPQNEILASERYILKVSIFIFITSCTIHIYYCLFIIV